MRKWDKYKPNPADQMTDLCGARVTLVPVNHPPQPTYGMSVVGLTPALLKHPRY